MAALPVIVEAPSNRSKCKACAYLGGGDPIIQQGSMRVGIPGRAAGVTVYHWCHPVCFAEHCVRVDLAPTGRAKCKGDGTGIDKGAVRLLVGYQKESTMYKVENVRETIVPRLLALVGRSKLTIHGLGELSLDERLRVEGLVYGGGSASPSQAGGSSGSKKRAAASGSPAAAPPASKRSKTAKEPPTKKQVAKKLATKKPAAKRNPKHSEEDAHESDGELCD
jgi:hypothetical protein